MKLEGQGPGLFNAGGGTIELTDEGVLLNKKNTDLGGGGIMDIAIGVAASTKGGMLMPYASIHSVNVNQGGFLTAPFMQVLMVGEAPVSDVDQAMKTPSCLLFKKHMLDQFVALKAEIEKRAAAAKTSANASSFLSEADEIKKFADLLDRGLITQAEFDAKKEAILGL